MGKNNCQLCPILIPLYISRLNVEESSFHLASFIDYILSLWDGGTHLGRKVPTRVTLAGELFCSPSLITLQASKETNGGQVVPGHWKKTFLRVSRNKGETQLVEGALPEAQAGRCPVEAHLPGQGQGCFKHDARKSLVQSDIPTLGTPLSRGLGPNTYNHHGPSTISCETLNDLRGLLFTFYWFSIYPWKQMVFSVPKASFWWAIDKVVYEFSH